jgi:hypothetical protein
MILISACGITWPAVWQRFSTVLPTRTTVAAGEVSVCPNAIEICSIPVCEPAFFITSTGHGAPAMIPVRSELRSCPAKPGSASSAMNIVGIPYRLVHRCRAHARSVAPGSNVSAGYTMHAPLQVHARLPTTIPKQWYSGTGMQTLSCSV